ncbi:RipA family octameric membrane protein [Pseudomonas fulva]|uniref:RipA family octameric membrane protein n=1 Tax=Pseudomonas fulva TaxID=47880 RepID=UPI0015E3BF4C|nr:hypothetical protein [Pseudomonas fulva]MBA1209447.1 hypothetical protein [Pseudomonas fulva]MDH0573645.1 hypothetical protein [Pseudomonas fulva]
MSDEADNSITAIKKKYASNPEFFKRMAEQSCRTAIDDLAAWKAIYTLSIELRNFEISQLVQRNNFFMIFQGVLFAGVCQSAGHLPIVSFVICLVGLFVSFFQAGMAAGAKYWQEHWEINCKKSEDFMVDLLQKHRVYRYLNDKLDIAMPPEIDEKLLRRKGLVHLFQDNSNKDDIKNSVWGGRPWAPVTNFMILRRFSSSRIPIYVGLALAIAWGVLLISTFRLDGFDWHVWENITGFKQRPPLK